MHTADPDTEWCFSHNSCRMSFCALSICSPDVSWLVRGVYYDRELELPTFIAVTLAFGYAAELTVHLYQQTLA